MVTIQATEINPYGRRLTNAVVLKLNTYKVYRLCT